MALYHSARGSVDYTIVGSPTIVDGVASGFSERTNYLTTNSYLAADNNSNFEIYSKFTTGTLGSVNESIITISDGTANGYLVQFRVLATKRFQFLTKKIDGTLNVAISPSYIFQDNTTYYVKAICNNLNLSVNIYDSGLNILEEATADVPSVLLSGNFNTTVTIGSLALGYNVWNGSIDLNNTYITVNGQPWFGICPIEVKKHQIMGPVGYTVTGSPTITDGVASGFSNSNYLQISQTYNATNDKNVEIYVRAKTPTTITSSFNPIFGADNIGYWGISSYTNALFTIRMGYSNGTTLTFGDMYISGGVQADTWYRFKIKGSNGIWRAEIYNDSGTLLNSSDRDWTSNTLSENYTIKLKCTDNTNTYSGSIDLNETYIKVNGKLWFWQPRETERIIVNGVEVWNKPVITHGYTLTATRGTYAYTSQTFDLHNASSWSYNTRYKYLVAGQAGGQWLFGNSNGYYTGPMLLITSQNRLATYLSSTGSGFNIAQEKQLTDMTFEVNKEYLISLLYTDVDGYNFKVTDIATGHIYNFNVSTNTAHINNTAPTYLMNNMGGLTNSYNQGIMYLADTSIIVDGVKVFDGATAEIGVDLINNGLTIGEE